MPRADPTFSHFDIIRLYDRYLTDYERELVLEYFDEFLLGRSRELEDKFKQLSEIRSILGTIEAIIVTFIVLMPLLFFPADVISFMMPRIEQMRDLIDEALGIVRTVEA